MRRKLIVCLIAAAAAAMLTPATVVAAGPSAGDQQYIDPLAGSHSSTQTGGQSSPSPSSSAPSSSPPPVAIDARAAVRAQIGGVERLARAMSMRLPALRPDRYRVLSPARAFAHRAGHLWEQAVLPARTRGSELLYCPANLAPIADR